VQLALEADESIVHRRIGDAAIPLGGPVQGAARARDHEQQPVNVWAERCHGAINLLRARRMTQQQHLSARPPAIAGTDLDLGAG
jgi:hypothetical protein